MDQPFQIGLFRHSVTQLVTVIASEAKQSSLRRLKKHPGHRGFENRAADPARIFLPLPEQ